MDFRADIPGMPRTVTLVPAQRQSMWGERAAVNFTFGSAGAALYLISICLQIFAENTSNRSSLGAMRLSAAGCVCLGLLAVATEAERPSRSRYLLMNARFSWMSRETLAALLFVPLALLSDRFETLALVASAAAALFIISQALLIHDSTAIAAWTAPSLPFVFVSSSLTAGAGLTLMLSRVPAALVCITTIACSAADLLCWWIYVCPRRIDEPTRTATAPLRKPRALLWTVVIGRVIPMTILIKALFSSPDIPQWTLTSIGLALFVGSWIQKHGIICWCGYLAPLQLQLSSRVLNAHHPAVVCAGHSSTSVETVD